MYGHGEKEPLMQLYTEFFFFKKETNLKKEKENCTQVYNTFRN